jgi:hypothetical protein
VKGYPPHDQRDVQVEHKAQHVTPVSARAQPQGRLQPAQGGGGGKQEQGGAGVQKASEQEILAYTTCTTLHVVPHAAGLQPLVNKAMKHTAAGWVGGAAPCHPCLT